MPKGKEKSYKEKIKEILSKKGDLESKLRKIEVILQQEAIKYYKKFPEAEQHGYLFLNFLIEKGDKETFEKIVELSLNIAKQKGKKTTKEEIRKAYLEMAKNNFFAIYPEEDARRYTGKVDKWLNETQEKPPTQEKKSNKKTPKTPQVPQDVPLATEEFIEKFITFEDLPAQKLIPKKSSPLPTYIVKFDHDTSFYEAFWRHLTDKGYEISKNEVIGMFQELLHPEVKLRSRLTFYDNIGVNLKEAGFNLTKEELGPGEIEKGIRIEKGKLKPRVWSWLPDALEDFQNSSALQPYVNKDEIKKIAQIFKEIAKKRIDKPTFSPYIFYYDEYLPGVLRVNFRLTEDFIKLLLPFTNPKLLPTEAVLHHFLINDVNGKITGGKAIIWENSTFAKGNDPINLFSEAELNLRRELNNVLKTNLGKSLYGNFYSDPDVSKRLGTFDFLKKYGNDTVKEILKKLDNLDISNLQNAVGKAIPFTRDLFVKLVGNRIFFTSRPEDVFKHFPEAKNIPPPPSAKPIEGIEIPPPELPPLFEIPKLPEVPQVELQVPVPEKIEIPPTEPPPLLEIPEVPQVKVEEVPQKIEITPPELPTPFEPPELPEVPQVEVEVPRDVPQTPKPPPDIPTSIMKKIRKPLPWITGLGLLGAFSYFLLSRKKEKTEIKLPELTTTGEIPTTPTLPVEKINVAIDVDKTISAMAEAFRRKAEQKKNQILKRLEQAYVMTQISSALFNLYKPETKVSFQEALLINLYSEANKYEEKTKISMLKGLMYAKQNNIAYTSPEELLAYSSLPLKEKSDEAIQNFVDYQKQITNLLQFEFQKDYNAYVQLTKEAVKWKLKAQELQNKINIRIALTKFLMNMKMQFEQLKGRAETLTETLGVVESK